MDIMTYMFDEENNKRLFGLEQWRLGEEKGRGTETHCYQSTQYEYGYIFYRKSNYHQCVTGLQA